MDKVSITLPRRRAFKNVFQFKVTLLEIKPAIWRRIQVPDTYTFYDLHVAIQDAMGWMDSHLHAFEFKTGKHSQQAVRIECPFALEDLEVENPRLSTEVSLRDYFRTPGDRCLYEYDFGDGWEHEVVLEGTYPKEPDKKYPKCIDGELACPPEDCGGISGYYECIKAIKNRDNTEGLLEWLGGWKPDVFKPERVKFWSPLRRLKMALED